MSVKEIYVANRASGVIHLCYETEQGRRFTLEQCNIDDIEAPERFDYYPVNLGLRRCGHCFPPDEMTESGNQIQEGRNPMSESQQQPEDEQEKPAEQPVTVENNGGEVNVNQDDAEDGEEDSADK